MQKTTSHHIGNNLSMMEMNNYRYSSCNFIHILIVTWFI